MSAIYIRPGDSGNCPAGNILHNRKQSPTAADSDKTLEDERFHTSDASLFPGVWLLQWLMAILRRAILASNPARQPYDRSTVPAS
jgi:hypothetical protein